MLAGGTTATIRWGDHHLYVRFATDYNSLRWARDHAQQDALVLLDPNGVTSHAVDAAEGKAGRGAAMGMGMGMGMGICMCMCIGMLCTSMCA